MALMILRTVPVAGDGGHMLSALPVAAQTYPVTPCASSCRTRRAATPTITARAVGAKLGEVFGQQVIVDNRPGGGTNIGSELGARAAPDGYTLFMGGASNAINMTLYAKPPYDTLRDFAPISLCVKGANVLSVAPVAAG